MDGLAGVATVVGTVAALWARMEYRVRDVIIKLESYEERLRKVEMEFHGHQAVNSERHEVRLREEDE
jgi:hypothetical protein